MKKEFIKNKTGYTVDEEQLVGCCPHCGMLAYHVKEDPYICFCTSPDCEWNGRTTRPLEKTPQIRRLPSEYPLKQLAYLFEIGRTIYFCKNSRMTNCEHPVIIFDDVIKYRFWIREYNGPIDEILNDSNLPVIRHYLRLEDIIEDGWELD